MKFYQRFLILSCIIWISYVLFSYAKAYYYADPFYTYLKKPCPQLVIDVFPKQLNLFTISRYEYVELLAWFDKKTGKEIFVDDYKHPIRMGSIAFSCEYLEHMADVRSNMAREGKIQPVLRIKWRYFFIIIFIPMLIIWMITYVYKLFQKN